jgi:hypothetical protein
VLAAACSGDDREAGQPRDPLRAGTAVRSGAAVVDGPTPLDCAAGRYPAPQNLPAELDPDNYRPSSARDPELAGSLQHHCGQRGDATDLAWGVSRGDPSVVVAVLDSGIRWRDADAMAQLARRVALNPGELPPPEGTDRHDRNGDGVVDLTDYDGDSRISDRNGNGVIDPQDLLLDPAFSDGVDDDGNGYVDDIAGWDFLHDDNDPLDDVDYGHGTGEALDAVAPADGSGDVGTCPDCRFIPLRVADSFIADSGRFAAGVIFATDHRAAVVLSALGAINNPTVAQSAIDAARAEGISVVASMADEQSSHANLPTALVGTIPVNSVTSTEDSLLPMARSYLAINGCTNIGRGTWVSVPSNGCSSEATGRAAGIVGLVESAARAADIPRHPANRGPNRLAPDEVAQVLRLTADDVDFATANDVDPADNFDSGPGTTRYRTVPGWDMATGFGRINAYEAVRSVAERSVPPAVLITSPLPDDLFGATGTVEVTARISAVRSGSFSWRLEWAPGIEGGDWREVAAESGRRRSVDGRIGRIDLAEVAAGLEHGATGPPLEGDEPDPERFSVRVRVVVTDAEGRVSIDQRVIQIHDDPDRLDGLAERVPGAGAANAVLADLDGDDRNELLLPTDDGVLHVWDADGEALDGWPRRTGVVPYWHAGSPTVRRAKLAPPRAPFGVGSVVVARLDGPDRPPSVVATDLEGRLHVWSARGEVRPGFDDLGVDPDLSRPEATGPSNRLKGQFWAQPAVGDLNGDGRPEIVAAAADRHLYAWHTDGTPVRGFPALVADPTTAAAIDPVTGAVTYRDDSVGNGGELIAPPLVADLDGDGAAEIIVGAQEQYREDLNVEPRFAIPGEGGNSRLYVLDGDGTIRAGWPVPVAMLQLEILPAIGNGVAMPAVAAERAGRPVIVATSAAGPTYVLDASGRSPLGEREGRPTALAWTGVADASALVSAFGGPAVGELAGAAGPVVVQPVVNDRRAIDQIAPDRQEGAAQLLAVWDLASGRLLRTVPTADLAFFVRPAISGGIAYAGNGVSTLDAIDATGRVPGWPKLTGGWVVGTPAVGEYGGQQVVITPRRDGRLLGWRAPTGR